MASNNLFQLRLAFVIFISIKLGSSNKLNKNTDFIINVSELSTYSAFRIAEELTTEALRTDPDNLICTSHVFVSVKNNRHHLFGNLNYHIPTLFPLAIIQMEDTNIGLRNLSSSFFDRELPDASIIEPLAFGVLRLSPNCVSVFMQLTMNSPIEPEILTNSVLLKKFGRPATDRFFYMGYRKYVNTFARSSMGNDIRYKYGITPNGFVNYCATRRSSTIHTFSRKCDTILRGKYLRGSTIAEPSVARRAKINGQTEWTGGICFHLLKDAANQYNFTFSLSFGGPTGYKDPISGRWKGVTGDVFNRDADIGLCTGFSFDRHYIVDPSISVSWYARVFYIRTPSTRTSWKSVFWPLDSKVWILVIVSVTAIIPVLVMARGKRNLSKTIAESVDTTLQIFLEQSARAVQRWRGKRIRSLLMAWALFSLVIGTGYRSKLVSFLTFLEKESVPRTHSALSLSGYKIYFRYYGGIAYAAAISSQLPMYKRLMRGAILVNSSRDCILAAALKEQAACMDYQFPADYTVSTNATLYPHRKNDFLLKSKDTDLTVNNIWSFRKGSPLRQTFDDILLARLETGLYERWLQEDWLGSRIAGAEWLQKQENNPVKLKMEQVLRETSAYPKSLKVSSLTGTFGILIVGLILGTLVWVMEVGKMWYRGKKYLKNSNKAKHIPGETRIESYSDEGCKLQESLDEETTRSYSSCSPR